MAKTATYTPSVSIIGDGYNMTEANSVTNANAPPPSSFACTTGFNSIPIPTGFTVNGVKVVPPPSNAVTLTAKGVTGDTGIPLSPSVETCLTFAAGATAFGLTVGGNVLVGLVWF